MRRFRFEAAPFVGRTQVQLKRRIRPLSHIKLPSLILNGNQFISGSPRPRYNELSYVEDVRKREPTSYGPINKSYTVEFRSGRIRGSRETATMTSLISGARKIFRT